MTVWMHGQARWSRKWFDDQAQREGVNKLLFYLDASKKSILGSFLLYTCINDLEEVTLWTLIGFVNDIKLRGACQHAQGQNFYAEDLHRLEEWANRNAMKFTAVKWEDLPLGRSTLGNSVAWYLADWGVAMLERLWGWQKAEYESAIHPGSRNGQQHPGPYEQSQTW